MKNESKRNKLAIDAHFRKAAPHKTKKEKQTEKPFLGFELTPEEWQYCFGGSRGLQ